MHVRRLFRQGETGTATVEFVLVFPILLFLVLILLQTTFLMSANFFVQYAAYAATRAAITQIPDAGDGVASVGRNAIIAAPGNLKFDAIERAAVFAVMPICGRLNDAGGIDANAFVAGLNQYFAAEGGSSPRWVTTLAAGRLRYAAKNTQVTLLQTTGGGGQGAVTFTPVPAGSMYVYGPREPVTVRVTHHLNLSIPYVRYIFADGKQTTADGKGAYTLVSAQYTLTNDGWDPSLPDAPPLPRMP